jgi:hypothetical protein
MDPRTFGRLGTTLCLLALVQACRDDVTTPNLVSALPTSLDLSDAAHGGRNGFYFLPPLVSAPRYTGLSDPNQLPTVAVCELVAPNTATAHCGTVVTAFSRTSGTGSELVRYDDASQQYIVNWQTDQCLASSCTLDPTKTYRVRVLVGAVELGHADVVLVNNASQMKNAQTGDVVTLVNGRTLPVKFRIEQGAVRVAAPGDATAIGTAGGAIATSDGQVSLEFSSGAVSTATQVTVAPASDAAPGGGEWAPPIQLGPDGTTFLAPVALTMHFDAAKLPPGVPLNALRMFTQSGSGWTEVPGSAVNEADNTVSAPIQHFSNYQVAIAPNTVQGQVSATSLAVGTAGTLTGWTMAYTSYPQTYCYPYSVWVGSGSTGHWVYSRNCWTTTVNTSYPIANVGVSWSSSAPTVLGFTQGNVTYTDGSGAATSPPLVALLPGTANITAATTGAVSSPVTYTSLGVLKILPHTAELVAGWSLSLQVTQTIATPNSVPFSLTSKNALTIGEAGTSNYTYGGQTGAYSIAANSTTKQLSMMELTGPRADTVIAFAPGYLPDTAVIRFVQGTTIVNGWPAALSVGDSVPLTLTAGDQNGAPVGNLAFPVVFALAPSSGLSFTDGRQSITSITVPQRTSPTFYLKAAAAGAQTASITSRDYVSYTNSLNVGQPIIDPFPQAGSQLQALGNPGAHVVVDVPMNNAGTGALRNMRIASTVNNCYNGEAVNWIHATFTENVVPVIMHLAVDIPSNYTEGSYDYCYTLAADGAPTRGYGVRVIVSPGEAVIDPFPQAGSQLLVSGVTGTHITKDVPINNAGSGALRNMRIASTVNNCYNGEAVAWVRATFTEGVTPVIMHLAIDPPTAYPAGTYDFCYTLDADNAAARSYGVRLTLIAAQPVIDPFPQSGFQLIVSGVVGTHITQDVPINNAGTGSLQNMRILSTVNNCYNGESISWLRATFTEGVAPVVMHLAVDPPATYPPGTYDFCYTLGADVAPNRGYGARLVLRAP